MRRMPVQIVDDLKRDCEPKPEHDNQQHGEFKVEICLFGKHKIARTEQNVLGVKDDIVDEIAETSGSRFEIEIDEYVNERADEVVEFLEDLLACVVDLFARDAKVGLQAQDPKVHDEPVRENDHEEPGAKRGGEYGHGEDARCYETQVPEELHDCRRPAHRARQWLVVFQAEYELLIA